MGLKQNTAKLETNCTVGEEILELVGRQEKSLFEKWPDHCTHY